MDELFINTTEEEAIKIAKHIRGEYVGMFYITGCPLININNSHWNFYRKFIEAEICSCITDNVPSFFDQPNQPNMIRYEKNEIIIKIIKHNPELFKHNMRFEKLKRILKDYE